MHNSTGLDLMQPFGCVLFNQDPHPTSEVSIPAAFGGTASYAKSMKRALFALVLLAAGCADDNMIDPVVSSYHRPQIQTHTQVVTQKRTQEVPSVPLVSETQVRVSVQPAVPAPRQPTPAMPPPARPEVYLLQVGPPVVINTVPSPAPIVAPVQPVYQAPVPSEPVQPARPAPAPSYLETAPGLTYQNGGVRGSTLPPQPAPSPFLPTAEGLQYRP